MNTDGSSSAQEIDSDSVSAKFLWDVLSALSQAACTAASETSWFVQSNIFLCSVLAILIGIVCLLYASQIFRELQNSVRGTVWKELWLHMYKLASGTFPGKSTMKNVYPNFGIIDHALYSI